jgi:hypothetical protein
VLVDVEFNAPPSVNKTNMVIVRCSGVMTLIVKSDENVEIEARGLFVLYCIQKLKIIRPAELYTKIFDCVLQFNCVPLKMSVIFSKLYLKFSKSLECIAC